MATKHNLHALETRIDHRFDPLQAEVNERFAAVDHRFEAFEANMRAELADISAQFEKTMSSHTRHLYGAPSAPCSP